MQEMMTDKIQPSFFTQYNNFLSTILNQIHVDLMIFSFDLFDVNQGSQTQVHMRSALVEENVRRAEDKDNHGSSGHRYSYIKIGFFSIKF
jgi:hypothetical protein